MVNVACDTNFILVELYVSRADSEGCLDENNGENQANDIEYEGTEELGDEAIVKRIWDHGFLAALGE